MDTKMQRHRELIKLIKAQGMLPVRSFAKILNVSEMTVRRDLAMLGKAGQVAGLEGEAPGDDAAPPTGDEYNLLQALQKANAQKDLIGRYAASLIQPNDVIIIDTGSTTARMLPYIPLNQNVTVLCFNANVLADLHYKSGLKLLFCGGVYHPNTEMFESPEGIRFIERIRANKVFLSAAGIHRHLGITCANDYEVPTKKAVIRSSDERILLADSSKFNALRSSYFCELADLTGIVTDASLSEEWRQIVDDCEIALHLVQ